MLNVAPERRKLAGRELDVIWRSGVNGFERMHAAAKRMTDYLLIDISNSFVKLAFATTKKIGKPVRLPTGKLSAADELMR